MKARISKLVATLLVVNMLFSSVPTMTLGAKETPFAIEKQNRDVVSSTKETVMETIQVDLEQEEGNQTSNETDPTQYTEEDIRSLNWVQLSVETAIQIHQSYDRTMLKLSAYFYSDLLQLLSTEEKSEVLMYTEDQALTMVEQLTTEQRTLLDTHTPLIAQKLQEREANEEPIELQSTTPPPVQYTEKQQEFQFSRPKTEQPVDPFYRGANVVENDVILEGKHGLDLVLQRRYHSMSSRITLPGWNEDGRTNVSNPNRSTFATGWTFTVPSIEVVNTQQVVNVKNGTSSNTQTYYTSQIGTRKNISLRWMMVLFLNIIGDSLTTPMMMQHLAQTAATSIRSFFRIIPMSLTEISLPNQIFTATGSPIASIAMAYRSGLKTALAAISC